MAATTFSIGASTYLVICNYGNVRRYETKSRVYRVNPDSALLVVRRLSKIMDCIQIKHAQFLSVFISVFVLNFYFFMHELQSLFIHLNSGFWYMYFKSIFDIIAPLWCEWKLRTSDLLIKFHRTKHLWIDAWLFNWLFISWITFHFY